MDRQALTVHAAALGVDCRAVAACVAGALWGASAQWGVLGPCEDAQADHTLSAEACWHAWSPAGCQGGPAQCACSAHGQTAPAWGPAGGAQACLGCRAGASHAQRPLRLAGVASGAGAAASGKEASGSVGARERPAVRGALRRAAAHLLGGVGQDRHGQVVAREWARAGLGVAQVAQSSSASSGSAAGPVPVEAESAEVGLMAALRWHSAWLGPEVLAAPCHIP